jgi:hypothetical protein
LPLVTQPIPTAFSASTRPAQGGCPSIAAIDNFLPSPIVGASFSVTGDTTTYVFDSLEDRSPVNGVPGLIAYCIYPAQPPGNPDSATALAHGANGDPFQVHWGSIQGYFAFVRGHGNPSNIELDGTTGIVMGTATWTSATPPVSQTILLHINDAAECQRLYGGNEDTCFVFPAGAPTPPPCNGNPACKEVVIDEAISTDPLTVPAYTLLHLHYTYMIVNQATNDFDMIFYPPTPRTRDINSGGGKDYFGCEQIPDPAGSPGGQGTFPNYQGTGFTLRMTVPNPGAGCQQSRFTFTARNNNGEPIVLSPGEMIVFTIDMVTRVNQGGHQEFTSCGPHYLNSGFTVKWFQSDDGQLHSFTTNPPIVVNVVGCDRTRLGVDTR